MPYNDVIDRNEVSPLIPEQVSQAMLQNLTYQSAVLSLSQRVPVSTNQTRFPVLSAFPTAYFVNGDTGLKQTTDVKWSNKFLNIEELAAIVPIPEAVADDLNFDIWGSIRPLLEAAIARALDAAVFFGINKPASWPDAIWTKISSMGYTVERGTHTADAGGLAEDINDMMAFVEADGYDVNGFVADRTFRQYLRGARDANGQRLLDIDGDVNRVEGIEVRYAMPGLWPSGPGQPEFIGGDWTNSVIGIRQDFTYKILDQAVIQDASGNIVYNLAQQDMVALRVVFRVGWQVANFLNYSEPVEANRYPWAAIVSPSPSP